MWLLKLLKGDNIDIKSWKKVASKGLKSLGIHVDLAKIGPNGRLISI